MIGYYIHHQGSGHRTRAEAIISALTSPVVALTSLSDPPGGCTDVVTLDRDDTSPHPVDVTADHALHWVPLHDNGLRERMGQIADFIVQRQPSAIVVDVSVEVAVFARLMGVPVVVIAMPGQRSDPPHRLAHRVADAIVAPWPRELYRPGWLDEFGEKTTFTGGISRHDGRRIDVDECRRSDVLVMTGTGGSHTDSGDVERLAADHPNLSIRGLGASFGTWVDDPWPDLCSARLVVINAGQGSVADVATAQRPALVLPQHRPFDEQHATATTLRRADLATVAPQWPSPQSWEAILDAARHPGRRPPEWGRWRTAGAAGRAAEVIEECAR
ncbi:MAG TPA: hypothetical protein DIW80_11235 [Gordonia polyisoprenivorans]|uniref:hypothetical protein n=1 Tax=Gordonia polyisoprenivorans TaxID=84595 RepID=UPI000B99D821|nr:hypothetical protein [Gordonia polyisoprenivorans]MBE7194250.1 hypothetical protein [Gordonia polyisoprenivorans]OZC33810.1 hypothetical protein CJJ17_21675 [Gordonia polyisoprenivorans]UZF57260.1 hypothetical protein LH935_04500 [Gordonia polyisoprenivorans]HCS57710.1 hypothetical protein [Gordonia polyisoprenivorans]